MLEETVVLASGIAIVVASSATDAEAVLFGYKGAKVVVIAVVNSTIMGVENPVGGNVNVGRSSDAVWLTNLEIFGKLVPLFGS